MIEWVWAPNDYDGFICTTHDDITLEVQPNHDDGGWYWYAQAYNRVTWEGFPDFDEVSLGEGFMPDLESAKLAAQQCAETAIANWEKAERELEEKLHEAYIEALKEEAELDDHRHDTSYG